MKSTFATLIFCLIFNVNSLFCQETTADNPTDTLKAQLSALQGVVADIKSDVEQVKQKANSQEKEDEKIKIKEDIRKKQVEAIKICAKFTDRFAHGTIATDNILTAMKTGIAISSLQSPFVNNSFRGGYDNFWDKWGKWLPAVILPTASLLTKNENTKIVSIPIVYLSLPL